MLYISKLSEPGFIGLQDSQDFPYQDILHRISALYLCDVKKVYARNSIQKNQTHYPGNPIIM